MNEWICKVPEGFTCTFEQIEPVEYSMVSFMILLVAFIILIGFILYKTLTD